MPCCAEEQLFAINHRPIFQLLMLQFNEQKSKKKLKQMHFRQNCLTFFCVSRYFWGI